VLIREHDKYGWWIGVGGHIELHEHPIETVKRECLEEVGLIVTIPDDHSKAAMETLSYDGSDRVEPLPAPQHLNIHRINESHQHLDLIYYATSTTDKVIPEKPTDRWVWLTADEVRNHSEMSEQIKLYALGALKALAS
jgi:8-oxo-dGTP pyrophosphatase MutT (NUDIX family)